MKGLLTLNVDDYALQDNRVVEFAVGYLVPDDTSSCLSVAPKGLCEGTFALANPAQSIHMTETCQLWILVTLSLLKLQNLAKFKLLAE